MSFALVEDQFELSELDFCQNRIENAKNRSKIVKLLCKTAKKKSRKLGLTPKPKDVDLLLDMLTYDYGAPDVIAPKTIAPGIVEFDTKKYDDFTVFDVNVQAGDAVEHCFSQEGPCVLLVHEGEGRVSGVGEVSAGKVFYITPGTSVEKKSSKFRNFMLSSYEFQISNQLLS